MSLFNDLQILNFVETVWRSSPNSTVTVSYADMTDAIWYTQTALEYEMTISLSCKCVETYSVAITIFLVVAS